MTSNATRSKADESAATAMLVVDATTDRQYATTDEVAGLGIDVSDVIANLHHLADRHGLDWTEVLDRADHSHYGDVTDGGGMATRMPLPEEGPGVRLALALNPIREDGSIDHEAGVDWVDTHPARLARQLMPWLAERQAGEAWDATLEVRSTEPCDGSCGRLFPHPRHHCSAEKVPPTVDPLAASRAELEDATGLERGALAEPDEDNA